MNTWHNDETKDAVQRILQNRNTHGSFVSLMAMLSNGALFKKDPIKSSHRSCNYVYFIILLALVAVTGQALPIFVKHCNFFSAIAINLRNISYLCTQKHAKLGGASAIGASSIAFGLHELCGRIKIQL